MNKLVAEIRCSMERAASKKKARDPNQPIFEYDSDEEAEGGTWEHKKRAQEMMSTLGMCATVCCDTTPCSPHDTITCCETTPVV